MKRWELFYWLTLLFGFILLGLFLFNSLFITVSVWWNLFYVRCPPDFMMYVHTDCEPLKKSLGSSPSGPFTVWFADIDVAYHADNDIQLGNIEGSWFYDKSLAEKELAKFEVGKNFTCSYDSVLKTFIRAGDMSECPVYTLFMFIVVFTGLVLSTIVLISFISSMVIFIITCCIPDKESESGSESDSVSTNSSYEITVFRLHNSSRSSSNNSHDVSIPSLEQPEPDENTSLLSIQTDN